MGINIFSMREISALLAGEKDQNFLEVLRVTFNLGAVLREFS